MARIKQTSRGKSRSATIDKQWKNNRIIEGRATDGRFTKGHKFGFHPGTSGNPQGRPRSQSFSEACRRILRETCPDDPDGRSYADVIAEKLCQSAMAGDIRAVRELADRAEGKPKVLEGERRAITMEEVHALLQQLRQPKDGLREHT
jgi:hypothetical protein